MSKIPNIFRAYLSVKETLVLSFHDFVFSKEGFLCDKNVIFQWSKNSHFQKGLTNDYVKNSKYFFESSLLLKETLVLSFGDIIFLKGGFFDDKNVMLKIPNIPRALFSVQETLVLSFHDVVFSIGGFLDDKNVILL